MAGINYLFPPDQILNLPTWRFQLQGRDATAQYFREQTGGFGRRGNFFAE